MYSLGLNPFYHLLHHDRRRGRRCRHKQYWSRLQLQKGGIIVVVIKHSIIVVIILITIVTSCSNITITKLRTA